MVTMKRLLLLSACVFLAGCSDKPSMTDTPPASSSSSSRASGTSYSLPADPTHGALTALAIGPLEGQGDVLANGSATIWAFADGASRATIQLNIAVAPTGNVYIAWLHDRNGNTYEKLGTMKNAMGDVRHTLSIEAQKDYSTYSHVVVSREAGEDVTVPSTVVANAILKRTAR